MDYPREFVDGHAETTILATAWLIKFHPERLEAWLARHAPGVEAVTRQWMADGRASERGVM